MQLLQQWQLLSYCSINRSDLTITLPNGSEFIFKGCDDAEKIKSIANIGELWVEEADNYRYRVGICSDVSFSRDPDGDWEVKITPVDLMNLDE